jgi:hypothetical protein
MNETILMEIVGWSGSAMVVAAYILNIRGKLQARSAVYIWLNIVGSIFLIGYTFYLKAYPNTVVNLIWVIVAAYSLIKVYLQNKKNKT